MSLCKQQQERRQAIEAERKRLLALTEYEAMEEGQSSWYQRLRYLREIEANEWVKDIQRGVPTPQPKKKTYYKKVSSKSYFQYD